MTESQKKRFPRARRSAFAPSADPNYRREFYILNPQDHAPLKDLVELFMPSSRFIGPNPVYNQAICAILAGSLPAAAQGEPYPVRPLDSMALELARTVRETSLGSIAAHGRTGGRIED